jgi:hypothetical protein
MPQLSRTTNIGVASRKKKTSSVQFTISPAYPITSCTLVNFANVDGVVSLTTGATYNLTPITTFTANVMIWGAGGGASGGLGGGGGFATGTMTFFANVSYNVVVGASAASGAGGGGSGIELLSNANTPNIFMVAGGGGGGASFGPGQAGAGGGFVAGNGAPGTGATAFSAVSPGTLRRGGGGGGGAGFGDGGSGTGGGGGGLYGGATNGSGGGGGGGFFDPTLVTSANIQSGSGFYAAANTMSAYAATYGQGGSPSSPLGTIGSNGAIIITLA